MRTLIERGCGLDVHEATVVACLLIVRKERRFRADASVRHNDARAGEFARMVAV
jgi:hypothetical protein